MSSGEPPPDYPIDLPATYAAGRRAGIDACVMLLRAEASACDRELGGWARAAHLREMATKLERL